MSHRRLDASVLESLASRIASFVACQSDEGLAKLVGFFHLTDPDAEATINLVIESSGRLGLSIEVELEADQ